MAALPFAISTTPGVTAWTTTQWIAAWQSKADADPALLATLLATLDLSGLPTSDPGGGKLWLNGGLLQVGP